MVTRLTAEDGVSGLAEVLEDGNVAGEEDEGDDCGVDNASHPGVLPAEDVVEERVVVGQALAGGGLVRGHPAGIGDVGELGGRLIDLLLRLLRHGTIGNALDGGVV